MASSPVPIPPRLAKGYSLLAENYFNLLSHTPCVLSSFFSLFHPSNPLLLLLLLLLFLLLLLLLLLLEPVEKREIYEDASINMAPRDRGQCFIVRGHYFDIAMATSLFSQRDAMIVFRIDMERWLNLLDSFVFERRKGKSR